MVIIIKEKEEINEEKEKIDKNFNRKIKGTLLKKNPKNMDEAILITESLTKDEKKLICEGSYPGKIKKWTTAIFWIVIATSIVWMVWNILIPAIQRLLSLF